MCAAPVIIVHTPVLPCGKSASLFCAARLTTGALTHKFGSPCHGALHVETCSDTPHTPQHPRTPKERTEMPEHESTHKCGNEGCKKTGSKRCGGCAQACSPPPCQIFCTITRCTLALPTACTLLAARVAWIRLRVANPAYPSILPYGAGPLLLGRVPEKALGGWRPQSGVQGETSSSDCISR